MPFDACQYSVCLVINSDNGEFCAEERLETDPNEGELLISHAPEMDIYAVIGSASAAVVQVELIGLRHHSVVYDGKMFDLSLGEKATFPFRTEHGNIIKATLSYIKKEIGTAKKEDICPSC